MAGPARVNAVTHMRDCIVGSTMGVGNHASTGVCHCSAARRGERWAADEERAAAVLCGDVVVAGPVRREEQARRSTHAGGEDMSHRRSR